MITHKAKFAGLLVLLASGTLGFWVGPSIERTAAALNDDSQIKTLLKDRVATLEEIVLMTTTEYQAARVTYDKVREAQEALNRARLDLCETAEARLAVLQEMLAQAKACEELAAVKFSAARAAAAERFWAKADRLEIEIAIERERARAK